MTFKGAYKFVVCSIIRNWRPFAILALLILTLISVIALFFLASGIKSQTNWIQQSYSLRSNVSKIAFYVLQIEDSQRSYVLTADESYLDKCYEAVAALEKTLTRINSFINSDLKLTENFNQINKLISDAQMASFEFLKLAKGDRSAAEHIYNTQAADNIMASLDSMIRRFDEIEDEQLIERINKIETTRFYLTIVFILAVAFIFVLFLLFLARKQRYIRFLYEGRESLLIENEELDRLVKARTAEVNAARELAEHERERVELLLQDCNHRIGNSLAQVSSLLNIQLRQTNEMKAIDAITAARDRIQTVAIAYHRLRLAQDMETTSVKEFLEAVVGDIIENSGRKDSVNIQCDIADVNMCARDATTLGIVLGELITNSMKHGFTGGLTGHIQVILHLNSDGILSLTVKDNGIGIKNDALTSKTTSLGMMVVKQLCMQFGGEPQYSNDESGGTRFFVILPLLEIKNDCH